MGCAWPFVDGIRDNEHREAVLYPTTPHPVTRFMLDCHGALGYRSSAIERLATFFSSQDVCVK
jgi:hypothetical protein